jgi:hypothetical protein
MGSVIHLCQERFVRKLPLKAAVLWGCSVYERQRLFLSINLGCFLITWGRCTVSFSVEVAVYSLVIVKEYRPSGRLHCCVSTSCLLCVISLVVESKHELTMFLHLKGTIFVTQMVTCAKCMTCLHKRVSLKVFDSGWYCNERPRPSDIIWCKFMLYLTSKKLDVFICSCHLSAPWSLIMLYKLTVFCVVKFLTCYVTRSSSPLESSPHFISCKPILIVWSVPIFPAFLFSSSLLVGNSYAFRVCPFVLHVSPLHPTSLHCRDIAVTTNYGTSWCKGKIAVVFNWAPFRKVVMGMEVQVRIV